MKLFLEQLEDRLVPALIWFGDSENSNFNDKTNWIDNDTGVIPTQAPTSNDDIFFLQDAVSCNLTQNVEVRSITISVNVPSSFSLYLHDKTLRTEGFVFANGTIQADSSGRLIIGGTNSQWDNDASFYGGTVELRDFANLSIMGEGNKVAETTIIVGYNIDTNPSVLKVTTGTSVDLGLTGQIYISSKGSFPLENTNNFSLLATEENPYQLDLEGSLIHSGTGTTTVNVGILMDFTTSNITLNSGHLIVNDVNDNLSVEMNRGTVYLHPDTTFEVTDDFLMTDGYFTLVSSPLTQNKNVITTKGNFYFDANVAIVHDLFDHVGLEWFSYQGEVVFGEDNILTTNIALTDHETDNLTFDSVTLGGEWRVNQNTFLPFGIEFYPIKGLSNQMYGDFAESTVNAEDLDTYFYVNFVTDNDGYRCKRIVSLD